MIYKIRQDEKGEIIPIEEPGFRYTLPPKIYGDLVDQCKHIWDLYCDPEFNASCLLSGRAGNGKSLCAKILCNFAIHTDLDVYITDAIKFTDSVLNYISNIKRGIVFIDEFEKFVDYSAQQKLLPIMSDKSRRMFILTANKTYGIVPQILNRPDRMFFHIEFDRMPESMLNDYCEEKAVPQEFRNKLHAMNIESDVFSFDALDTMVRYCKKYDNWDIKRIYSMANVKGLIKPRVYTLEGIAMTHKPNYKIPYEAMNVNETAKFIIAMPSRTHWVKHYNEINGLEDTPMINRFGGFASGPMEPPMGMETKKPQDPLISFFNKEYPNEDVNEIIKEVLNVLEDTYNKVPHDEYKASPNYNGYGSFDYETGPSYSAQSTPLDAKPIPTALVVRTIPEYLIASKSTENTMVYTDVSGLWEVTLKAKKSSY